MFRVIGILLPLWESMNNTLYKELDMPFILKQNEKSKREFHELHNEQVKQVSGGAMQTWTTNGSGGNATYDGSDGQQARSIR